MDLWICRFGLGGGGHWGVPPGVQAAQKRTRWWIAATTRRCPRATRKRKRNRHWRGARGRQRTQWNAAQRKRGFYIKITTNDESSKTCNLKKLKIYLKRTSDISSISSSNPTVLVVTEWCVLSEQGARWFESGARIFRGRVTGELGDRHIGVEGNRSSVPFGVEMEWGFGVGRHVNRCV